MNSNARSKTWRTMLATLASILMLALVATAQVKTESTTEEGQATQQVTVERGEVVYVSGNDLIVQMEDGEMRHFSNVPETATVTVDGKDLTIRDLKPGMKLQRTTVTTTTPKTIRTVQSVTGKVWHVNPPNTVVLTLEDGSNKSFTIPKGQVFMVEGQEVDAFGLRKGMNVTATKITETPSTEVASDVKRTGQAPMAPPADAPLLIETASAEPAAPAAEPTQVASAQQPERSLPQTATLLPFLGLIGMLLAMAGLGIRTFSRR